MVRKAFKWYAGGFWLPHIHLNRSYRDHLFRFLFKDKQDLLDLYEHQSTKNPNMPLRGFLYFARQYEGLVTAGKRSLYGRTMVPLPSPKYVVFYNGTEDLDDETTLYLSDAFSEGRGSGCL